MSLVLNIDPEVKNGDTVQHFWIEHKGETLKMAVYKSRTCLKASFEGPKDFKITRFKHPERIIPNPKMPLHE